MADTDTHCAIAIVGGGPAGLSAAIWSARYGHSVVLIDRGDPRNWESRGINGYLGLPGVLPADLRARGREECAQYGVRLLDAEVVRAEQPDSEQLVLTLDSGERIVAARLLIAVGIRDVWPDVPGLEHVYGANAHVCPDCDGYDARGSRVAVIGRGKRAVAMALALTTWTTDIIICTNGQPPEIDTRELQDKLDAFAIRVFPDAIVALARDGDAIINLTLRNGTTLDVDKIFFTLAQVPADDVGAQLNCERDRGGHIVVSEHGATSVRSVFAAGDITPGPQLAIRATSAGAVAAMAMHKSLRSDNATLSDD